MVSAILRTAGRSMAGAILLVLLACAAEVGVRIADLRNPLQNNDIDRASHEAELHPCPVLFTVPPMTLTRSSQRSPRSDSIQESGGIWNSWGLRGDEPVVPKPASAFRVLWLGDEALGGTFDATAPTAPDQLSRFAPNIGDRTLEVWNGGRPHAGPLSQLLWFRRFGRSLEPDLVILQVEAWQREYDDRMRRFVRLDSAGHPALCPHPQVLGRTENPVEQWRRQFRLIDWGVQWAGDRWLAPSNDERPQRRPTSSDDRDFTDVVGQFLDLASAWNVPVILSTSSESNLPSQGTALKSLAVSKRAGWCSLPASRSVDGRPASSDDWNPEIAARQLASLIVQTLPNSIANNRDDAPARRNAPSRPAATASHSRPSTSEIRMVDRTSDASTEPRSPVPLPQPTTRQIPARPAAATTSIDGAPMRSSEPGSRHEPESRTSFSDADAGNSPNRTGPRVQANPPPTAPRIRPGR